MEKSYIYRIYPNNKQIQLIQKYIDVCVYVYNYCLEEIMRIGEDYNYEEMMVEYAFLKMKYPILNGVKSDCVHLYLNNLYKSYVRYKKGKGPQPQPKNIFDYSNKITLISSHYFGKGIDVQNKGIWTTDFGLLKTLQKRDVDGKVVSATIKRTSSNKYYISICCTNIKKKEIEKSNKSIGIDLGIHHFLVMSNGEKIENPRFLSKSRTKIKKCQRQLSRKEKGSNNYEANKIKLAKIEEHVVNQRRNFIHQLTLSLIKNYDIICVESLNIKSMQKDKRVSKGVHDASWYQFIRTLEYKARFYGKKVIKVNTYFPSSQKCSVCGYINSNTKDLNVREWECPMCRTVHDRDINAAKNILQEGLKQLKV